MQILSRSYWTSGFELTIPRTSSEVLAAAAGVDPRKTYDLEGRGILTAGYRLYLSVEDQRLTTYLWSGSGRTQSRTGVLRATVNADGASSRIVGQVDWFGQARAFAAMPLLIAGLVVLPFWAVHRRPDEAALAHALFVLPVAVALLAAFALRRFPGRKGRDTVRLQDALKLALAVDA
ncbi:MAG TPA: hypothetical protein VFE15_00365 [Marmoricola sp.]|nr:hypothetical protein [Marmoricola sp.]